MAQASNENAGRDGTDYRYSSESSGALAGELLVGYEIHRDQRGPFER